MSFSLADSTFGANSGPEPSFSERLLGELSRKFQRYLDASVPHLVGRWIAFVIFFFAIALRIFVLQGFYIVAYAYGIYLLHLFIGFLSPQDDPDLDSDGLALPTRDSDEFKPFVRRLPEFKFWYAAFKASVISLLCTFFSICDIPVFWPILLMYFIALVFLTMKRQIKHMIKHKYVPFSFGKKRFGTSHSRSGSR